MVSVIEKVIDLNSLKFDFFEKVHGLVTVHLYIKNLSYCHVQFETNQFTVFFCTSNKVFLKTHDGDNNDLFRCHIHTSEEVQYAHCTYKMEKCYIEINIKTKDQLKCGHSHFSEGKSLFKTPNFSGLHYSKSFLQCSSKQLLGGKSTPLTTKSSEEQDVETSSPNANSSLSSNVRNVNKINIASDTMLGLTGLENYANNCYMNVVLQLLANIYETREYFKNEVFLKDIAVNNPLSSGGKVAKAFSEVVKALWLPSRNAFKPLALKSIMGKQCASFLGWQQHDAQEFFSSLLDNLHEDLNQQCNFEEDCSLSINEKPDTAWNAHIKRNNSLIVKLFHGQLMSKVTCTACHKVSHSYDPCAQISLPIPSVKHCFRVLFFPSKMDAIPLMIPLQVSTPNATVWHLLNMLQSYVKILPCFIRLFSGLSEIFTDPNIPLASLFKYKYIIACEVIEDISLPVFQYVLNANSFVCCDFCYKREKHLLTKLKRCTKCFAVSYCSRDCQIKHWQSHKFLCSKDLKMQVGIPFYINIKKNELTYEYLESSLKMRANTSVDFTYLLDKNLENNTKSNILIKVSDKMNVNDDTAIIVSKDNFSEVILKGVCLIVEWQNSPEEKVLTKEEPVCEFYKTLFKETPLDEEHITLSDSLRLFMEPEKLDGNESWKCPKCKSFQIAKKEMAISMPSCLLLLHLKRFSFGEYGEKITKSVSYPLSNFDMSPYVCKESLDRINYPLIYDLCGVISHHGTMRMGHYTCMAKMFNHNDQEEGGWRLFDDENATRIKPEKVVSSNAYVLVYRLRGTSELLKVDRCPLYSSATNVFISDNSPLTKKKSELVVHKESTDSFANIYKNSFELTEDKKITRKNLTTTDRFSEFKKFTKFSEESLNCISSFGKIELKELEQDTKNIASLDCNYRMDENINLDLHDTVKLQLSEFNCDLNLIDISQCCVTNDDSGNVIQNLIDMNEDELD
ncbi:ubiquitin carboxyl-terminal hydrolase 19 isoform X3 [Hydra vulgaris]|uniref:Ubiquitin carboxyl-terminal hydrolase n=2 Tax=Hydra vulgaris TaxID=6087 RepID=A0ABM4D5D9_HYDVU